MQVIDRAFVRGLMPARDQGGHKGTFGKVYLLGGSVGYTGAPVLCAGGAVHSGCGLVFLGVPETVWPIAAARCLCAMPHPLAEQDGRLSAAAETEIRRRAAVCDAVAVGCGLGRSEGSDVLVRALLTLEKPLVLDADGINALAGHIDTLSCRRGCVTVLTPHDGEFTRIGGDLTGSNRRWIMIISDGAIGLVSLMLAAAAFAADHGVYLIRKGHRTVAAAPDGRLAVNTTGNDGMAKGGSGDVLTGLLTGLLAQGMEPFDACCAAVWIHGRAGDMAAEEKGRRGMTPADMIEKLPYALKEVE